jgi:hypothetical protein
MRRIGRRIVRMGLSALVLGLAVVQLTAGRADAITYDDSFEQCNYPKTFDLVVLRPISLLTLAIGTFLFVPLSPLALVTVRSEVGTVYDNLIGAPARFTFDRRLGECTSVQLSY